MEIILSSTALAIELLADFNYAQIDCILAHVVESAESDLAAINSKLHELADDKLTDQA